MTLQEMLTTISMPDSIATHVESLRRSAEEMSACWGRIDSTEVLSFDSLETGVAVVQEGFLELLSLGL